MMITDTEAFAASWVAAWNRHDVEAVLEHFHDDIVFTSPVAARLIPASGGVVRGKAALRSYWVSALGLVPDLHFTVEAVSAGTDCVVITYRNQLGNRSSEVLVFDGDLVREGHGTYQVLPVDRPTARPGD